MTYKTPIGLILLLWGGGLGAAGQYAKVSVIYDLLPQVYPQAGMALGFLVSIVGFVGIVFGVVAGTLVSNIGYRRALIWALWAGAALLAVQALFPPLWLMLVLRAFEGVSHLAIVVAAPTLIAQLAQTRHRGFALTLWSTFFGVAFTMLVWFGLPMVAALGLPSLFVAHGIWMAVFAVALSSGRTALPDTAKGIAVNWARLLPDHLTLYRSAFLAAPAIGWLFYTFCFLALLTLLPPFIAEAQRAVVLGAMLLVSILVSMTMGVVVLRWVSAITVVLGGFAGLVLALIWLLAATGGVWACFALASALGLVQGASFAAVPQLNAYAADQARANGALAQMGNIGNTLGTPVLAAILLGAGYSGMILTAIIVASVGLLAHLWMQRVRHLTQHVRSA